MLMGGAAIGAGVISSGVSLAKAPPALRYGPAPGIAKLNANENPYGPSPKALQAMSEAAAHGAYYVGESVPRLKSMIAERHGLTPENISLSSGSSGVLSFFAIAKGKEGKILGPDLFWDTTAKAAERQGTEILRLPKAKDLAIDLDALYERIDDSVSLVHVTNPNNPTGLTLDGDALRKFCVKASKKVTVLVDEAYNELTEDPEYTSMVPLVKAGHNVAVARTFSKIYGLAGMRVGYMLSSPAQARLISQYGLGDYALNQAGVAAAIASYNDTKFLAMAKARIVEAREAIVEAATGAGLKPLPSQTNFVFVDLGKMNAEAFREKMAGENVLIRGIYRDYTNWSRVSMGKPEAVSQYIAALPKVVDTLFASNV
jgi:histidinol-phosphate aminotransferase